MPTEAEIAKEFLATLSPEPVEWLRVCHDYITWRKTKGYGTYGLESHHLRIFLIESGRLSS